MTKGCWNVTEVSGKCWTGNAFIKFKREELRGLPSEFKKVFVACGNVAYIEKRVTRATVEYEIRFKRHGYNIAVTASDIVAVKVKFLEAAGATQRAARVFNGLPILATVIDEGATAALSIVPTVAEQKEVV